MHGCWVGTVERFDTHKNFGVAVVPLTPEGSIYETRGKFFFRPEGYLDEEFSLYPSERLPQAGEEIEIADLNTDGGAISSWRYVFISFPGLCAKFGLTPERAANLIDGGKSAPALGFDLRFKNPSGSNPRTWQIHRNDEQEFVDRLKTWQEGHETPARRPVSKK